MTEGLNEHQKMMRARGRPKILLATNYEDALNCMNCTNIIYWVLFLILRIKEW